MKRTITFDSASQLSQIYCNKPANLDMAESKFNVKIVARDGWMTIEGDDENVTLCETFFETIRLAHKQGMKIVNTDFINMLTRASEGNLGDIAEVFNNPIIINLKRKSIVPKNINQKKYLQHIQKNEIVFGVGPAGTGKTYLAVASALKLLQENVVEKIILTRPAVEAGEALGFLPGDLQEKLLPYLRPLYDSLNEMIGSEETEKLMERQVIEIAPLAYMRGRTLSNAFIILDEAQNTTNEQMMMFLTRLGENSRMIITGDITQIDLPKNKTSGLKIALEKLNDIKSIKLFYFDANDVVRHRLVTKIISAYQKNTDENI